jgi:ABC-type glutathione transport system ATPase component
MCRGEVVESGAVDDVLSRPQHEYTRRLVAAVPESMDDLAISTSKEGGRGATNDA